MKDNNGKKKKNDAVVKGGGTEQNHNKFVQWIRTLSSGRTLMVAPSWTEEQRVEEFRQYMKQFLETFRQNEGHRHSQGQILPTTNSNARRIVRMDSNDVESSSNASESVFGDESDVSSLDHYHHHHHHDDAVNLNHHSHVYFDRCNVCLGWSIVLLIVTFVVMSVVVIVNRDSIGWSIFETEGDDMSMAPSLSPSYYAATTVPND